METQTQTPEREMRSMRGSFEEIPAGDSAFAVMGKDGDTKFLWNKENAFEVEMARENFEKFKKKGYLIFKVTGKNGEKGEQASEFDPTAERYICSPPMQGG